MTNTTIIVFYSYVAGPGFIARVTDRPPCPQLTVGMVNLAHACERGKSGIFPLPLVKKELSLALRHT